MAKGPRKRGKRRGYECGHGRRWPGTKPRQVKSALTGAMIDATKDGYPCARRPKGYTHPPHIKTAERRAAWHALAKLLERGRR